MLHRAIRKYKFLSVLTIVILTSLFFINNFNYPFFTDQSKKDSIFGQSVFAQEPAQATPDTDLVFFAITEDAPPVSSSAQGTTRGFCKELLDDLEEEYEVVPLSFKTRVPRFRGVEKQEILNSINFVVDSHRDRYSQFFDGEGTLAQDGHKIVECGPSSITRGREISLEELRGKFSDPFFLTETKLLLKKENHNEFYSEKPFEDQVIGVLNDTTTDALALKVFPFASVLESNQAIGQRGQAADSLEDGTIVAYASDAVILQQMIEDDSRLSDYTILPKIGNLSYEEYGIVAYNDQELLDEINQWIRDDNRGVKAKNDHLKKRVSLADKVLEFFASRSRLIFYVICSAMIALYILLAFPWMIFLISKFTPRRKAKELSIKVNEIRRREKNKKPKWFTLADKVIFNQINASIANIANPKLDLELDGQVFFKLLETEVAVKERLDSLRKIEPEDVKLQEQIAEELASKLEKNPGALDDLRAWAKSMAEEAAQVSVAKISENIVEMIFAKLKRTL